MRRLPPHWERWQKTGQDWPTVPSLQFRPRHLYHHFWELLQSFPLRDPEKQFLVRNRWMATPCKFGMTPFTLPRWFLFEGERVGRSNKNSSAKENHFGERQHKSPFLILKCQWGPPNHQQRRFPDKILLYCSALSVYARPGVIFYRQFLPFANILQL